MDEASIFGERERSNGEYVAMRAREAVCNFVSYI